LKRQYLNGELSGNNNQEMKKLQIQIGKLEQMIGKLTIKNYILKKRERIHNRKEKIGFNPFDNNLNKYNKNFLLGYKKYVIINFVSKNKFAN